MVPSTVPLDATTVTVAWALVPVAFTVRMWVDEENVAVVIFKESPGATVNVVVAVPPLYDADNVTSVDAETPLPWTGNEIEDWPAGTVTVDGTFAALVL